jgi:peptidoglycan/LPS O-acetylase OafA/YrhL
MGTPFVLLGMMLKSPSSLNSFMSKTDNKTILLLTIAALFISVIEYYYQANILHLRQIGDLNLFTIPAAIGIMMIALKNQDVHPKAAVLVYLGKYSSTKIYLYHLLIYFSLNFLYLLTHHRFLKVINGYFGVLFLSIIISLLFHFTEAKLLKANTSSDISK